MNHVNDTKVQDVILANALAGSAVNYGIDYYQRDYAWEEKQVVELLDDLFIKFNETYKKGDHASLATSYKQYFLGSYVLSRKENKDYIIDGQQRLTTLMLIFLSIYHLSNELGEPIQKARDYVCSDEFEESAFKIDVSEREQTMNILLKQETKNIPIEVVNSNLYKNYYIIFNYLKNKTDNENLPVFYNWLAKRVLMVSITAYDDNEAYTIFEAMNDRGKKLSNLDMLKGYLLSLVNDDKRSEATKDWDSFEDRFDKVEDFDKFLIDLFRAKWARSTGQTNSKQKNKHEKNDWSEIQNHYHRFIKEKKGTSQINIKNSDDVLSLFNEIDYYSQLCVKLDYWENNIEEEYEELCYVSKLTPHMNVLYYALIQPFDDEEDMKIKIISKFLDIRLGLYSWNMLDSTNDSNFSTYIIKLIERVKKHQDYDDYNVLTWFFYNEIEKSTNRSVQSWGNFDNDFPIFRNGNPVKPQIYYILARATSFFELKSSDINNFQELYNKKQEIEHILAADFENNDTFNDQESLDKVRNVIGGLGLLPKKINGSLNDKSFKYKVAQYQQHNIFLGLMNKDLYKENGEFKNIPEISKFIKKYPVLKKYVVPYENFDSNSVYERGQLLRELAKIFWNTNDFVNFIDTSLFSTIEEIEVFIDATFVEDELDLYDKESNGNKADSMFKIGDIIYYTNNGYCLEGIYEGKGKICLTKLSNVPIIKSSEDQEKLGVTLHKLYTKILSSENTLINNDSYSWSGKITKCPIKSLINLAHGKIIGGHIQLDALNIKNSSHNVLFSNLDG